MILPRIKNIRSKLNMTQEEFSDYLAKEKQIYISRGTIAKYESGVNFPSKRTLKKLSNALNISEDYLAGKGIDSSQIDELLTNLLHNTYFNFREIFPDYDETTEKLHNLIRIQLDTNMLLSKCDPSEVGQFTPQFLYLDKEGNIDKTAINTHFPRFKKIDNFWKKMFSFLYDDKKFKDTLIGNTKEEFIENVTNRIDYQHEKDALKFNTITLIDTVDSFAADVKADIFKWEKGLITKEAAIEDINDNLQNLNIFIPKLGFGKNDKSEQ